MQNLIQKHTQSIFFVIFSLLLFSVQTLAKDNDSYYQNALKLANEGKHQQSIGIFQQLIKQHPETLRFQYDYILTLGWADKNEEVLLQASKLKLPDAPAYVLEAVARAARNKKEFDKSEQLYRQAIKKMPDRIVSKVGLALVLIDNKKTEEAIKLLLPLKQEQPGQLEVLFALEYAYNRQHKWFMALATNEKILALAPGNNTARRNRVFILDKVGAVTIANSEAQKFSELFSKEEIAQIRWSRAAFLVRSGKISNQDSTPKYEEIDEAIRQINDNIDYANSMSEKSSRWWKTRAQFDLIVALHARYDMQEVLDRYQALEQKKITFPPYVLIPVADAYLYLENPEKARDLYQIVLNETAHQKPTEQIFYAKISKYFALLESEQNQQATAWIEQLTKNEPEQIQHRAYGKRAGTKNNNPWKLTTEILLAMDRAYNDDLPEAQTRLETMLNKAPNNQEIRSSLANIYTWRGWPRKAERLYQVALANEPDSVDIQISRVDNLNELKKFPQADSEHSRLMEKHFHRQGLKKQNLLRSIHNSWELLFEVTGGESSGSQEGSKDLSFESYLYAPPVAYNYRPFLHYKWAEGLFPEGRGDAHREGIGIEYSIPDWLLTVEAHHNHFASNRFGGKVAAEYAYDDELSFSASFDSLSADTPLRALSSDIYAKSVNGSVNYRISEARSFSLGAGYMDFSDDNERYNISGSYYERWLTTSRYKFATELEVYHSGNSSDQGPYFSPKNDLSFGLSLDNKYLTYRFYDLTFHQHLKLNVGGYWQERFDTGVVGSVRYEHLWSAWNRVQLAYGITGMSRLYDADRENGWEAYLRLNWRM